MSALFGVSAQRLAGLSARLLGWSADQFWNATPEELATVLLVGAPPADAPPTAKAVAQLMKDHPDG